MSAAELTALLLFCTAMSFSPGPNTTLSTALAANFGLRRALRFCLAVPTGWILLMLASGVSVLLSLRNLDAVIKIDRSTGQIRWILSRDIGLIP